MESMGKILFAPCFISARATRAGVTAEKLSYKTNLSIATINRLKAGEHLSLQGICALAEALDIDPLLFFMENDNTGDYGYGIRRNVV